MGGDSSWFLLVPTDKASDFDLTRDGRILIAEVRGAGGGVGGGVRGSVDLKRDDIQHVH